MALAMHPRPTNHRFQPDPHVTLELVPSLFESEVHQNWFSQSSDTAK